jgi:hypothetical protein
VDADIRAGERIYRTGEVAGCVVEDQKTYGGVDVFSGSVFVVVNGFHGDIARD